MPEQSPHPNYRELVRFLVEPLLEFPDELRIDCESYAGQSRVWVRLAFGPEDKGRVFGRGGRTIQSIRLLVKTAANLAGHSAHLEVHGLQDERSNERFHDRHDRSERSSFSGPRRSSPPRRRNVH
jgi:hypothetical protein